MDFLKEILGDELFKQISEKLKAYNENPDNKDRQIKLANLTEGNFIPKQQFDSVTAENQTNAQKLTEANALIEQLKKSAKGDEALQTKISEYQIKVAELETELVKAKINAAVKVGLMSANAVDVDYLTYKLGEKGEKLELDEQGNIKGWNDKISALKTQFPTMFTGPSDGAFDGYRPIEKGTNPDTQALTRADILKKPYSERVKLFNENPENYSQIMKG